MKNLYITDDQSATKAQVMKMTCDCGWVEKAFRDRSGLNMAIDHIKTKHTTGIIHDRGQSIEIK